MRATYLIVSAVAWGAPGLLATSVAGAESQPKPGVTCTEEMWPADEQVHAALRAEMADGQPGEGVQPPRKLRHVLPKYPKDAVKLGIEGLVVIEGRVDPRTGATRDVRAVKGPAILAKAAIKAADGWKYQPLIIGRVKHEMEFRAQITFFLEAVADGR